MGLVSFPHFVVALKNIKRGKKAHQISHTFPVSLFISFHLFQPLSFPHTQSKTHSVQVECVWFISRYVSSMAHFHKSHVSMFVARGTLTRGRSPNTEHIKPLKTLPTHSVDRLHSHIHQRTEEVGKFHAETARKYFVIRRVLLKESVCV